MAGKLRTTCWKDWKEWTLVYNLIFKSNEIDHQREGLQTIEVWRSRNQTKLPVAIDCTSCLLSANLGHVTIDTPLVTKRLSLAMALVRFVNGMVDQEQKGVYAKSIQTLAEEIEIPDWLVDIRHDATHSSLPSLEILEAGCTVALNWLRSNYWEQTYQAIDTNSSSNISDEFDDLLHQYIFHYWPSKAVDKCFFESFSTEISKKMSSVTTLRNTIIPSLLKCSHLLPSQSQIEELMACKFREPLEQAVEFWKPLIFWIQEKKDLFVPILIDYLLKDLESTNCGWEIRRFATILISALVRHIKPATNDVELHCRILKHCLLDPCSESKHLAATVANGANLTMTKEFEINELEGAIKSNEDIFTHCCFTANPFAILEDYTRLKEYFAAIPTLRIDLSRLKPTLQKLRQISKELSPWSTAGEVSWNSIQGGVSLKSFQDSPDLDEQKFILKLPKGVNRRLHEASDVNSTYFLRSGVSNDAVEICDHISSDEPMQIGFLSSQLGIYESIPQESIVLF